jgi:FKBP-type peptidyl-prolyl cis-trans isomerase FkpA
MKKIIMAASAAIILASCGVNYEKTASGLVYKIFQGKGGDSIKAGNYIKYDVQFYLTDRSGKPDSLLSTPSSMPQYFQVDTGKRVEYSFMEIMTKLKTDDSAVVIISADSLKSKNALDPKDSIVFTNGSNIQCRVKVKQVFKDVITVRADYEKEVKAEEGKQIKVVEDYMASKGLKGIKTKNGAFVVLDNPGDVSLKADSGKIASVKYRGYLMSDNTKVFDTNMDSSKGHTEPYDVPVGARGVIAGWDEALPYFGKGATGKIFVPSFLGYGPQGNGPDLPPNANLIFDIQIVDVKDAPPAPQMGGRPMGQMGQ